MFSLMTKSDGNPRLTIKPLTKTDLVLLCPNLGRGEESLINPDDPTSDSILEGHVVLSLVAPTRVGGLQIELVGKQNVYCDGRSDTYETMHSIVDLDSRELGALLCPGDHTWVLLPSAARSIPADGLPYINMLSTCPPRTASHSVSSFRAI